MVTMGAKEVFQVVVGAGQVRDIIAVEEPRPVAPGDFEEMHDARFQLSSFGTPALHRTEQTLKAPSHMGPIKLGRVAQEVGSGMHPSIGTLNGFP
jgi:hypothetical protein